MTQRQQTSAHCKNESDEGNYVPHDQIARNLLFVKQKGLLAIGDPSVMNNLFVSKNKNK